MNKMYRSIWNAATGTHVAVAETVKTKGRRGGSAVLATSVVLAFSGTPGTAQAALVNLCSGVSLPPSAVTNIVGQAVLPITNTLTTVPLLSLLGLSTSLNTTLTNLAAGAPISLSVLDTNGNLLGATNCNVPVVPSTPAGIALGGNQISGLGAVTPANAGEINSIAIGNGAATNAAATNSIALGTNASVGAAASNSVALGAGSSANTGAQVAYAAFGLAAPQTSVGEVSVGFLGSLRIISNVAPGSALTDAVNVEQLQAVDNGAVKYDNPVLKTTVTLGGAGGTKITNVAPGTVSITSSDAINGSQLFGIMTTPTLYFHALSVKADSQALGIDSVAIGPEAVASGVSSVAMGLTSRATSVGGVALGANSVADRAGMSGATEKYSNVAVTSIQGAVSVGSPGNERQITNVAGGTAPTDAVNMRQLDAVLGQANQNIATVQRDANAGTAAAMAAASLPLAAMPGKTMAVAGVATYQGQSALAIGISSLSDNGRWVVRFNGSTTTRGNVGAGAGVGFYF